MSGKLTESAYQSLIDGNINWLIENTSDCLERQHIIAVLMHSVESEYPCTRKEVSKIVYVPLAHDLIDVKYYGKPWGHITKTRQGWQYTRKGSTIYSEHYQTLTDCKSVVQQELS